MNKSIPVLMSLVAMGAVGAAAAHDNGYGRDSGYGRDTEYGRDGGPSAYIGFRVGQLRYKEEGLDAVTPGAALFDFGATLSPNLAIEGRLGGGLWTADTNTFGVEVRSIYAGYLKGSLPLAPGFSLYALGGVASVDLRRDFGLVQAHDSGFSYGIGMNFQLYGASSLSMEWTRLASGNNLGYNYNVDMASFGMSWRF